MEVQSSQRDISLNTPHSINARGKLISLEQPIVMGILNLTPDSFYAGSRLVDPDEAIVRTGQMLDEGAVIIDIGAASSRPGSDIIPIDEELRRLMAVLEKVTKKYPQAIFSVDTWRAEVAQAALSAGAHLINDISAGTLEPEIMHFTAQAHAPFIAMHMLGTPGRMPVAPQYSDVAGEVLRYFVGRMRAFREAGISDIILDPGFGFGKTVAHNFSLLRHLEIFQFLELPMLVGLSRKSMIWRTLDIPPEEALNGTTALHILALQKGVQILRVHDVKAAREAIKLYLRYQES
jgi:dihydropteroate synthase